MRGIWKIMKNDYRKTGRICLQNVCFFSRNKTLFNKESLLKYSVIMKISVRELKTKLVHSYSVANKKVHIY